MAARPLLGHSSISAAMGTWRLPSYSWNFQFNLYTISSTIQLTKTHLLGGLGQLTNGRLARGQLQQTQNATLDLSEKNPQKLKHITGGFRLLKPTFRGGFWFFKFFGGATNF